MQQTLLYCLCISLTLAIVFLVILVATVSKYSRKFKRILNVLNLLNAISETIETVGPLPAGPDVVHYYEGCFLDQRREIQRASVAIDEIINQ